jgi:hypothetical protein
MEVLTDVKAGERREDGAFENGTVNHKVDKRLKNMAEKVREFQVFPSEGKTTTED